MSLHEIFENAFGGRMFAFHRSVHQITAIQSPKSPSADIYPTIYAITLRLLWENWTNHSRLRGSEVYKRDVTVSVTC